MKTLMYPGTLAMVARWKPVHAGHAAVLRGLVASRARVLIGIGSCNRYDADNPFTMAETAEMIRLVVGDAVTIFDMPDYGNGPRWRAHLLDVLDGLGPVDAFVTANPYVRDLMRERCEVVHPVTFVPPEERVRVDGTMVRAAMAWGDAWEHLVPDAVAGFLKSNGLVERFVREFGEQTRRAHVREAAVGGAHGR